MPAGPAAVAAVFTPNTFAAAPVKLSQAHLAQSEPAGNGRYGWTQAIVSTSGCANAATGVAGAADQAEICTALATALGIAPEHTLALSTGLIGTRLPVAKVVAGITDVVDGGGLRPDVGRRARGRRSALHDRLAGQVRDDDRRAAGAGRRRGHACASPGSPRVSG